MSYLYIITVGNSASPANLKLFPWSVGKHKCCFAKIAYEVIGMSYVELQWKFTGPLHLKLACITTESEAIYFQGIIESAAIFDSYHVG